MKKNYIFFTAVIFTLGLYLTHNSRPADHNLPYIPPIKSEDITGIVIKKADSNLMLRKNSSLWRIFPGGYPADPQKVAGIIDTIKNLDIVMLISESDNYVIFGLDDRNKITVRVYNGETLIREFQVGNTGPSRAHTFVRIGNDRRIYYADKTFRNIFEITAERLRDKG
ncbi:MAG: DUF4340 domain-containing protein [Deferribacteres bacterium]|nr:DUF4340 domain-containing protein [Deferribacteres bacterium]